MSGAGELSMALLDFEIALGNLVRARSTVPLSALHLDAAEISCLESLKTSAGFEFTVGVQRSWCVGRATRAGSFSFSVLSKEQRRQLLDEWVEAGGGTSSFFAAESEALLEFVAGRLPHPSHELTACRFEQATLRANQSSGGFVAPDDGILFDPGCTVRRGPHAAMVAFYGEPSAIVQALVKNEGLPSMSADTTNMLFGPGLDRLWRVASARETELWQRLAETTPLSAILSEGYSRGDLAPLLREGIVSAGPSTYPEPEPSAPSA